MPSEKIINNCSFLHVALNVLDTNMLTVNC